VWAHLLSSITSINGDGLFVLAFVRSTIFDRLEAFLMCSALLTVVPEWVKSRLSERCSIAMLAGFFRGKESNSVFCFMEFAIA